MIFMKEGQITEEDVAMPVKEILFSLRFNRIRHVQTSPERAVSRAKGGWYMGYKALFADEGETAVSSF